MNAGFLFFLCIISVVNIIILNYVATVCEQIRDELREMMKDKNP